MLKAYLLYLCISGCVRNLRHNERKAQKRKTRENCVDAFKVSGGIGFLEGAVDIGLIAAGVGDTGFGVIG